MKAEITSRARASGMARERALSLISGLVAVTGQLVMIRLRKLHYLPGHPTRQNAESMEPI